MDKNEKSKINRRRKVRAACKIAPYAVAIGHWIAIHSSIEDVVNRFVVERTAIYIVETNEVRL